MRSTRLLLFLTLIITNNLFAQYGTGDETTKEEFNKILIAAERGTRDLTGVPSSFSLKQYAPSPGHQHEYGTCVAWSTSYAARTISYAAKRNITNQEQINKYAFSPGYIYYKIKNPDDVNCKNGSNIEKAMYVMQRTGNVLKSDGVFDCAPSIPASLETEKATPFKIKDYLSLTEYENIGKNEIIKIKKSLTEKKPVVISLKCFLSLSAVGADGLWIKSDVDQKKGNHAMCIVGYDDKVAGGAFEVQNSWGTLWGNKGFFWLTYNQLMTYGNYAVEMMDYDFAQPKISGNIQFVKMDGSNMPVKRSKISTRSMSVEDDESKAEYSQYKLSEIYPGGTAFKMKFNTTAPAYLYIFAEDDKGEISRFFPYNPTVSAAINSSDASIFLPAENKHARLSNTPGKENICVLYSKTALDFEGLLNYIKSNKVNMAQAIKDKYQKNLMNLSQVNFDDNNIKFTAPANDNSVLCFFIEMQHN